VRREHVYGPINHGLILLCPCSRDHSTSRCDQNCGHVVGSLVLGVDEQGGSSG
jgi:hypothetical protein